VGVFSGKFPVLHRFRPPGWSCAYLANAASGRDFGKIGGRTSGARYCVAQPRVQVVIVLCSYALDNLNNHVKVREKSYSVRGSITIALSGALNMKNVYEVLRQKEMELTRLEKEVEALRLVAPLLSEEKELNSDMLKPALATAVNGPQQPIRIPAPSAVAAAAQPVRASGWDDTAKRWP
jgi:hypothetical protein